MQTHLESYEKVLATFRSLELKRWFVGPHCSFPHPYAPEKQEEKEEEEEEEKSAAAPEE